MSPSALALSVLWTLATGHPDAGLLAFYADSAQVPHEIAWAVAWQESRHNLNPALRGRAGEVGRFQLMRATARALCPGLNIYTYTGNVACGLRYLRSQYERTGSWSRAIRAYQCPACKHATAYERSVVSKIGYITLKLAELMP